jgi:hypothetical protein
VGWLALLGLAVRPVELEGRISTVQGTDVTGLRYRALSSRDAA